jgi:hypothetical protein
MAKRRKRKRANARLIRTTRGYQATHLQNQINSLASRVNAMETFIVKWEAALREWREIFARRGL